MKDKIHEYWEDQFLFVSIDGSDGFSRCPFTQPHCHSVQAVRVFSWHYPQALHHQCNLPEMQWLICCCNAAHQRRSSPIRKSLLNDSRHSCSIFFPQSGDCCSCSASSNPGRDLQSKHTVCVCAECYIALEFRALWGTQESLDRKYQELAMCNTFEMQSNSPCLLLYLLETAQDSHCYQNKSKAKLNVFFSRAAT